MTWAFFNKMRQIFRYFLCFMTEIKKVLAYQHILCGSCVAFFVLRTFASIYITVE